MDACVAQTPQMARQHAAALLECEQLAQKILDGTQQNVLDVKQGLQLAPLPSRPVVGFMPTLRPVAIGVLCPHTDRENGQKRFRRASPRRRPLE